MLGPMNGTVLRIGELARRARVPADTIRYYEKIGLLAPPDRTRSGYRSFDDGAVTRLRFIRRAQDLGFTLEEIGALLTLRVGHGASCAEVRVRATARLTVIERKIERLERMRRGLTELIADCGRRRPSADCPILEALGGENDGELTDD